MKTHGRSSSSLMCNQHEPYKVNFTGEILQDEFQPQGNVNIYEYAY